MTAIFMKFNQIIRIKMVESVWEVHVHGPVGDMMAQFGAAPIEIMAPLEAARHFIERLNGERARDIALAAMIGMKKQPGEQ